jgi:UDP-N-acetylmuramoyl-L-alanyl-D-glutamate--2,6-diaminopimelate ligase
MMSWRLADLLAPWITDCSHAQWAALHVDSIALDTRQLKAGGLFIASVNRVGDGRRYLAQAIAQGAHALLVSEFADDAQRQLFCAALDTRIPLIEIPHLADIASAIVARFYGDPSTQQKIIAITGTNGKTTCSYWLAQIFSFLGKPCGVIGTLGMGADWRKLAPTGHTTPDAVTLHRQLAQWQQQGIDHVAMEASSHALDQYRLAGLHLQQAILTQVSRDHLDYHGTLEAYAAAKRRLFSWPNLKTQIVNGDDVLGQQLWQQPAPGLSTWVYHAAFENSDDHGGHLAFEDVRAHNGGYQARLHWRLPQQPTQQLTPQPAQQAEIFLPFPGRYNLENALAVIASLLAMQIDIADIVRAFGQCQLPPGRMQSVANQRGFIIYVDFAHTPEALAMALLACREQAQGKLWVIVGCGGDRDAGKRPLMGKVAAEKADLVMLTADNPRSESAADIAQAMLAGMASVAHVQRQLDRRLAIAQVLQQAQAGDVILVAGKGHETTQIIGDQILAFDDVQVIQQLLQESLLQE